MLGRLLLQLILRNELVEDQARRDFAVPDLRQQVVGLRRSKFRQDLVQRIAFQQLRAGPDALRFR